MVSDDAAVPANPAEGLGWADRRNREGIGDAGEPVSLADAADVAELNHGHSHNPTSL